MYVVGLDIGGANLKAADLDGHSVCRSFEIWKAPDRLSAELSKLVSEFRQPDLWAVTMTAELADCYPTKAKGVDSILTAMQEVAGTRRVFVWQTGAEFVTPEVAREIPLLVAAANWHALATFVGRIVPKGGSLLLDIGSTTTDIIPLSNGVPIPKGMTDCDRLQAGELVYTGVERTPLCAVAHTVPFRDGYCPLAAEFFATTLDVYLTLGDVPEDPHDSRTANGHPKTVSAARDRLARMLCCDRTELSDDDVEVVARFLADVQKQRLLGPLERVLSRMQPECGTVMISGAGMFLARRLVESAARLKDAEMVELSNHFSPRISLAACAFAVARLAAERLNGFVA